MQIHSIQCDYEPGRLTPRESLERMRQWIDDDHCLILKNAFPKDEILKVRERFHQFGQTTPEQNPQFELGMPNFHRRDIEPPKAAIKRIMHSYSSFFWNASNYGEHEFMLASLSLKFQLSGLAADYYRDCQKDGYVCSGRVSHYPLGGGYYGLHADPIEKEKCTDIIILSQQGVDFKEGGLYVMDRQKKKYFLDSLLQPGDIVYFKQSNPHGVAPVDPNAPLNWESSAGRWMMFSTVADIGTFHGANHQKGALSLQP